MGSSSTNTTRPGSRTVADFYAGLAPDRRRVCRRLAAIMRDATGTRATMWGDSMVGFGRYAYTYASGRSGEWFRTGFSPRSRDTTVYLMDGFDHHRPLLERLGPHRLGRSCLYLRDLDAVDEGVLEELIRASVAEMARRYPV